MTTVRIAVLLVLVCQTAFAEPDKRQLAEKIVASREASGRKLHSGYRERAIRALEQLPVATLQAGASSPSAVTLALGDSTADLVYTTLAQPCRIIDTRIVGGALSSSRDFKVAGTADFETQGGTVGGCGIPLGPATAAVVNFVAVNPAGGGNLRAAAWPHPVPATGSIINYQATTPAMNIANGVIVPICDSTSASCGTGSDLTIQPNGAAVHLVADVLGFFSAFPTAEQAASSDLTYATLPQPCRIIDTRLGGGALSPGEIRHFMVAGIDGFDEQGGTIGGCGVPDGAKVAMINFVAVNPVGAGNLKGSEYASPIPTTGSVINYQQLNPSLNIANGLPFPICDPSENPCNADINLQANGAGVHVVADVVGYFSSTPMFAATPESQHDLTYTTFQQPCRIIDTRSGGGMLTPGNIRQFKVTGNTGFDSQGGQPSGCAVPADATVAMINFVAVGPQGSGNLRGSAYPNPIPPTGSVINYQAVTPPLNIANGLLFPVCDSAATTCSSDIMLQANGAAVHLVADVLGYARRATPALGVTSWLVAGNAGTNTTHFLGTTDAQPLVVKTGGIERMRISANGNIGVGTDDPQSTLQISNGYFQVPIITPPPPPQTPQPPIGGEDCDSPLEYGRMVVGYAAEHLYLCSDDSWSSVTLMQPVIGGDATIASHVSASRSLDPNVTAATPAWLLAGNSGTTAGDFLGTVDPNPLIFKTAGSERMRLTAPGRLGIGTTAPQSTLHVPGLFEIPYGFHGIYVQLPVFHAAGPPPATDCDSANEAGRTKLNTFDNVLEVCNGTAWRRVDLCHGVFTTAKFSTSLSYVTRERNAPLSEACEGSMGTFGTGYCMRNSSTGVFIRPPLGGPMISELSNEKYRISLTFNVSSPSPLRIDYKVVGTSGNCHLTVGGTVTGSLDFVLESTVAGGPRNIFRLDRINNFDGTGLTFFGCGTFLAQFGADGVVDWIVGGIALSLSEPAYCLSCDSGGFGSCSSEPLSATESSHDETGSIAHDKQALPALAPQLLSSGAWWRTAGNTATAGTFVGTTDAKPLVMKTAGLERMRIAENGFVGIGTTTVPQSALHVGSGYLQVPTQAGEPPAADCDSQPETGRIIANASANLMYICGGSSWTSFSWRLLQLP